MRTKGLWYLNGLSNTLDARRGGERKEECVSTATDPTTSEIEQTVSRSDFY